jgi:hypothetical protein
MNKKIGIYSTTIHLFSIIGFAFCLIINMSMGNYVFGIFIALSFIPMIATFVIDSKIDKKSSAYSAIIFAGIYSVFILFVYFAQITTVRLGLLNEQAMQIISSQKFGLFFNYDLLGYGIMALSTFFIGLTIEPKTILDKHLKLLLLVHGIFFVSSFILPILGIFNNDIQQSNKIGPMIQTVWCTYFSFIDVLSIIYFKRKIN